MNAVVYRKYGGPEVLHTAEIEMPEPEKHQVRVKVYAAGVNFGDLSARNFRSISPGAFTMPFLFWVLARFAFGLTKPRQPVLGNEFAGVVDKTGSEVKKFRKGQKVFGYTGEKMGAYAEYLCIGEDGFLTVKPEAMSFEEAASVPMGTLMALNILNKADLQPGKRVLINGASGGIGSAAVQLAKQKGAEVTGVCGTPRIEYVRTLGADRIIDYTKEDFTAGDETYDLVVDILGKSSFCRCRKVLSPDGCYLRVSFKAVHLLKMLFTASKRGKKVRCVVAVPAAKDLETIKGLIDADGIKTVVDRSFPMEEASGAHRYVEQGERKGPVVIVMKREGGSDGK